MKDAENAVITTNAIITVNNVSVIETLEINGETVYIYKDICGGDRAKAYFTNELAAVAQAVDDATFFLSVCKRASREKDFLTAAVRILADAEAILRYREFSEH